MVVISSVFSLLPLNVLWDWDGYFLVLDFEHSDEPSCCPSLLQCWPVQFTEYVCDGTLCTFVIISAESSGPSLYSFQFLDI